MIKKVVEAIYSRTESIIGRDALEFFIHSKNYISASFFTKALAFLSLPILTRLLTTSDYGIIAVFTSVTSFMTLILGLCFTATISRYYFEKKSDFADFLGANMIFLCTLDFVIVILVYIFRWQLSHFLNIDPYLIIIASVIAFMIFTLDVYVSYLTTLRKSWAVTRLSITKSVLILVTSIIWIWSLQKERYMGRVYAELLIVIMFFLYAVYKLMPLSRISFKTEHIKYSLVYGIPLVSHVMAGIILESFDRIQINQLTSSSDAGLYSFAYTIGMLMYVIIMGANQSWWPMFYEYMDKGEYGKIVSVVKKYAKSITFAALLLVLFSGEIVMIMADKKFYGGLDLIPIVVLSYTFVFLYTLYGNFTFYDKKTYLLPVFTGIAALFNIVSNYALIPVYGYKVAAVTTLLSYMLLFVLHYFNTTRLLKRRIIGVRVLAPEFIALFFFSGVYMYLYGKMDSYLALFMIKIVMMSAFALFILRNKVGLLLHKQQSSP
jgi:O-antigen/teichoic acid export membrane protein